MMNYYTIFDLDNKQIGLVGSVNIVSKNRLYDLLIVIALLVGIGALIVYLMEYYKEWRMKQNLVLQ